MRPVPVFLDGVWRNAAVAFIVALVLWAALWVVSLIADGTRIPSALSESARESSVLVCKDGKIEHDGSFFSRLFGGDGQFQCTDWHTRNTHPLPNGSVDWPSSPRR